MKYHENVPLYDLTYKWAVQLISDYWNDPRIIVAGCGILLLDWNQQYYRLHGMFDLKKLEKCVYKWHEKLSEYRQRNIRSLKLNDEEQIKQFFEDFEATLKGCKSPDRAPVSTAKALHILASSFFPPWDTDIAEAHGCGEKSPEDYTKFMDIIKKEVDEIIEDYIKTCDMSKEEAEKAIFREIYPREGFEKSLVKLIDECNFAKVHLT